MRWAFGWEHELMVWHGDEGGGGGRRSLSFNVFVMYTTVFVLIIDILQDGYSALMLSAYVGHVEAACALVQAGADLTLANNVRLVGEEDVVEVVS